MLFPSGLGISAPGVLGESIKSSVEELLLYASRPKLLKRECEVEFAKRVLV